MTASEVHFEIGARSAAEGAVEERGEAVFGLTYRLPLHRAQTLHSLNQGREPLLELERRQRQTQLTDIFF